MKLCKSFQTHLLFVRNIKRNWQKPKPFKERKKTGVSRRRGPVLIHLWPKLTSRLNYQNRKGISKTALKLKQHPNFVVAISVNALKECICVSTKVIQNWTGFAFASSVLGTSSVRDRNWVSVVIVVVIVSTAIYRSDCLLSLRIYDFLN